MANLYNIALYNRFSGCNHCNTSLHSQQDGTYTTPMQKSTNLLQVHTYEQFLTNLITLTNLELLYIYEANWILLCAAHLLFYSKCKQCNCQDTISNMQQCNIHTTYNQKGIITVLKYHFMLANSYCLVVH